MKKEGKEIRKLLKKKKKKTHSFPSDSSGAI
jgi:hypothetical protein